jgi:hypothetical protein
MDNRYHRDLDLPNYSPNVDFSKWSTEGYKWLEFHKTLQLPELNNQPFVNFLRSLGMTSYWIEVFYTPPGEDGVIHADNTEGEDWAKIIFQYGAKGSTMRWWSSTNVANLSTSIDQILVQSSEVAPEIAEYEVKDRTADHYHGRILASRVEDATILYEAEINNASLANVGILHSSHNPTNEKRFVITVALFDFIGNRILWDDAIRRLSPYIKTSALI